MKSKIISSVRPKGSGHEYQRNKLKIRSKKLFLILVTTFTLSCCNKDDNPFMGSESLPPATQTGANTVGCLVNGKVFLPHAEGINAPVNCFYQFIDGEFFFSMNFADLRGTGFKEVFIQTGRLDLEDSQIYILNKNTVDDGDFTGGGGGYSTSINNNYYTNTIKTGELKITRVDVSNSIISGTFWFDAVNAQGEIVEIREGRFDMKY